MSNNAEEQKNKALAFMGMSSGILSLVIAAVVIFPILCCFGICLLGFISAPFTEDPVPTVTESSGVIT